MRAILSPRSDTAAKSAPNSNLVATGNFANADGLTEGEATELVAWLREAGYISIEVVRDAERCSVRWNR